MSHVLAPDGPGALARTQTPTDAPARSNSRAVARVRGLAILCLFSIALTWLTALGLSFLTEPRRGASASGEVLVNAWAYGAVARWDCATSTYVETIWQTGVKRPWGPEQATGAPDTPSPGDHSSAWASATQDGQAEWLALRWRQPVEAAAIHIHQSYNPGAIDRVSVALGDGSEQTVWSSADGPAQPANVLVVPLTPPRRIDRVKLSIDSMRVPGWNEIDAVALADPAGAIHTADRAEASSTYAARPGSGAVPDVPAWCALGEPPESLMRGDVSFDRCAQGAFGWPCRAWVATRSIPGATPFGTPAGPMRAVPVRPLLRGVLANAGLTLGALIVLRWTLLTPLRTTRRVLRMQRGGCPSCGYDLRYDFSAGCAECGFLRAADVGRSRVSENGVRVE